MIKQRTPTRLDATGERMVERVFIDGPEEILLSDLVDWLVGTRSADCGSVRVHSAFLSWERDATIAEKAEWAAKKELDLQRNEKWEWDTYVRLKRKFESIEYSDTEDMGS